MDCLWRSSSSTPRHQEARRDRGGTEDLVALPCLRLASWVPGVQQIAISMGSALLCLFGCLLIGTVAAKKGFLLTLPREPRVGYPEKICLTFHDLSPPVEVTMTLRKQQKVFLETTVNFDDLSGCATMTFPRSSSSTDLDLHVEGTDNSSYAFHADQRLTVAPAPWTTLVLLDRPIYTAGDTVRFRVLTHDPDLLPYLGPINQIVLFDPRMTTMKQWFPRWNQVISKNGFAEFQFPLASAVVSGPWAVRVQISGQKSVTKRFLVLPKLDSDFHIEVRAPAFVPVTASVMEVTVCLRDAEGRRRRGHVRLVVKVVNSFRFPWATRVSLQRPTAVLTDDLQGSGCSQLTFNVSVLRLADARYSLNGAQLLLRTSVRVPGEEDAIIRDDVRRVKVTQTDGQFEAPGQCGIYFKPGLPFSVKFHLKRLDGSPALGTRVQVTSKDLRLDTTVTTDDQGMVKYDVPVMLTGLSSVTFTAKALGSLYRKPAQGQYGLLAPTVELTAVRQESPSHSYLYIVPQPSPLPCNASLLLEVYVSNPPKNAFRLHSQLTTRGSLLFVEVEEITPIHIHSMHEATYTDGSGKNQVSVTRQTALFRVRLKMDANFAPVAHLLVYYVTSGGEVVADTLIMPIKPCNPDMVSLDFGVSEAHPGQELKVTLTGVPRSVCALGVSDLPPGLPPDLDTALHPQAFWDGYQEAFSQHEWCTSVQRCQGSGTEKRHGKEKMDSSLAFQMAGLTVLSDLKVGGSCEPGPARPANHTQATPRRGDLAPHGAHSRRKRAVITFSAETLPSGTVRKVKKRGKESLPNRSKGSRHSAMSRSSDRKVSRGSSSLGVSKTSLGSKSASGSRSSSAQRRPDLRAESRSLKGSKLSRDSHSDGASKAPQRSRSQKASSRRRRLRGKKRRKGGRRGGKPASAGPSNLVRHLLSQRYPDAWLWQMVRIRSNGTAVLDATAPPRLTEWRGVAVCVGGSGRENLAVSAPRSLRVSAPLQAWLELPPSAVLGERLHLTAGVYSSLPRCLQVVVQVEGGEGVAVERDWQRTLCVCQAERKSVLFSVAVMDIGDLSLSVKAEATRPDAHHCPGVPPSLEPYPRHQASYTLPVTTVGKETGYSTSLWLCPSNSIPRPFKVLDLPLPMDAVAGSGTVKLSVTGHVLGPSLAHVRRLVGGRGAGAEWALSSFSTASTLLHALSLSPLHHLTPPASRALKAALLDGYQRVMTFRHADGSYSVFGRSGDVGSTWLTAYVIRSLAQASTLMTVDQRSLDRSVDWLISRQTGVKGCFQEKGKAVGSYFQGFQGGQNTEVTLTAHVLLALIEAGIKRDAPVLQRAVKCVTTSPITDVYTLALSTYALTRLHNRSPTIRQFLPHLMDAAIRTETEMHWERGGEPDHWREFSPFPHARAVDVETTSYALLALTALSDVDLKEVTSIVRWLLRQRNHFGGFISSQDTVVAIHALAMFTSLTYNGPPNLKVMIQGHLIERSMSVTYENNLDLQQLNLSAPNSLSIGADGSGCALVQVSVRWTSVAMPPPNPSLSIHVQVSRSVPKPADCSRRSLITCASYKSRGRHSGLVALTVKMVTGWTPDTRDLNQQLRRRGGGFDYYEEDPVQKDVIHFYFLEMGNRPRCVHWEALERTHVEDHKPAYVELRDVYRPEMTTRTFYTMHTNPRCVRPDPRAGTVRSPAAETAPHSSTPQPAPSRSPAAERPPPTAEVNQPRKTTENRPLANVRLPGQGRPPRRRAGPRQLIANSANRRAERGRREEDIMEGQVTCPVCRVLQPAELVTAFCTAQAAYKVQLGTSRDRRMVALSDFRSKPKSVVQRPVDVSMPRKCICRYLEWKRGKLLVLSLDRYPRNKTNRKNLVLSAVSHITPLYQRQARLLRRTKRTGMCERIP